MGQLNTKPYFPFTREPNSQHTVSAEQSNEILPASAAASEDVLLRHPRRRTTPMLKHRHRDDFNLALENIRASGFGELTPRQKIVLDQMLHDFPWMATIPGRR